MTRIATRDGVCYDVHDRGRGPATVLLHGFAGSSRTWDAVADGLGRGRRLVAIDLLGHGGSDAPPAPRHDVECQAADLAWLIGGLVDGRPDVVGYSFGARVALWLAVLAPGVPGRLVLESPSAGLADGPARAARVVADEGWATLLEEGGLGAFHDAWEAQPIFASRRALTPEVRDTIREGHLAGQPRGLAASLRGAGQGTMRPLHRHLADVRIPTLVVAGGLDPSGRERATEVAGSIPDARLAVIDDAGHAPHLERPEAFLRVATPFLDHRGEP